VKTRIEVNENGEFFTIIPEDVVAGYEFDEGDLLEWDDNDPEFVIVNLA
jgi:hypothetical protein